MGPGAGTLLIMGGGDVGPRVGDLAWRLTGPKARWVYIPTALRDEQIRGARPPYFVAWAQARSTTLHTRDRTLADSEAFVAPLKDATAVFIDGGRQWRLADAYLDTRLEGELHALLARGGFIAGASAGAAIMASFLMRGSPMGTGIVVSSTHQRGFGFITHSAIDEHVLRRQREADLGPVIAAHPELFGLGLDEGAAALVRGQALTAVNERAVLITDGADHGGKSFYPLARGAKFDLSTWRVS
jgi:cyanophycinase